MPGQPVERDRDALVVQRFAHHPDHLRAGGEIAVGVQHALRQAGRSRREQDLGRRIGIDMEPAFGHRGIDGRARQRAKGESAPSVHGDDPRAARFGAIERGPVGRRVLGEHQARLDDGERVVEPREIARQRIVGRDRRHQHAGTQRAEQEDRVLETVVGQDRDRRAVRAEILGDQPRGDGAGLRPRRRVGQALPGTVRTAAFGEESDVGPA